MFSKLSKVETYTEVNYGFSLLNYFDVLFFLSYNIIGFIFYFIHRTCPSRILFFIAMGAIDLIVSTFLSITKGYLIVMSIIITGVLFSLAVIIVYMSKRSIDVKKIVFFTILSIIYLAVRSVLMLFYAEAEMKDNEMRIFLPLCIYLEMSIVGFYEAFGYTPNYFIFTRTILCWKFTIETSSSWKIGFTPPAREYIKFRESLEKNKVALETIILRQNRIIGTIMVANISFEKVVFLRFSSDGWKSYFNRPAIYLYSTSNTFDTFGFEIDVPMNEGDVMKVEFRVYFNDADGLEYCDSNNGRNYSLVPEARESCILH